MSYQTTVDWINRVLARANATSDKQLRPRVEISSKMTSAIDRWAASYEAQAKENSLNLAAAIAGEYARLTTLEMHSEIKGGNARATYLDRSYQRVLQQLRIQLEYGLAKGGLIFKPYWDGRQIRVDFIQADNFYPLAFDENGGITSCIFVSQLQREGKIFTRFELHDLQGDALRVLNFAYQTGQEDNLGQEIPLADVPEWAEIADEVEIKNTPRPLYGYFKAPLANVIDTGSPLGVSVYSKAEDLIAKADEQYRRILWEYKGSELAIDANAAYLKRDASGRLAAPEGKERLYREYDIAGGINDKPFFNVFSPEIRDGALFNGLNRLLQRIEFNCSLAYGTLSDVQLVEKTAEEIRSSKQRTYSAISDCQAALEGALEDLIAAMDYLATLYQAAPQGAYEIAFEWDDSIIVDTATEGAIRLQEVAAGLLRAEEYIKWRYGLKSDEEARALMPGFEDLTRTEEGEPPALEE